MLLVVVYVGAVAVLFLFVVMMLDVDFDELRQGFANYLALGGLVGLILLGELIMMAMIIAQKGIGDKAVLVASKSNIRDFGRVLYTDYAYLFEGVGFVLLVAMIGAIVLTLKPRASVKRQDAFNQVTRRRKDSVEIVKVKSGEGISQ